MEVLTGRQRATRCGVRFGGGDPALAGAPMLFGQSEARLARWTGRSGIRRLKDTNVI